VISDLPSQFEVSFFASSGESVGDFSRFPTWNSVGFDFYAWS